MNMQKICESTEIVSKNLFHTSLDSISDLELGTWYSNEFRVALSLRLGSPIQMFGLMFVCMETKLITTGTMAYHVLKQMVQIHVMQMEIPLLNYPVVPDRTK